jgi:4-hydroxy-tetrahydrodipicolinate reductase
MKPTRVAIHGAAGKMGRRLVALATADSAWQLVGAIEHPGHPALGSDAAVLAGAPAVGVPLATELPGEVDVAIDFSVPEAGIEFVRRCHARKLPVVVATTGFSAADGEEIRRLARDFPLLQAPSMSLAVNLAMKLVRVAGEALREHPTGADVEIIERHHRFKEDSPSGTALKFGQIAATAMGLTRGVHGREGRPGARPHDEIGYHAVRTGDNPGEHTILFGLLGESLEINVRASNRDCYAHGALAAAKFLVGRPAGLYDMTHVLGL